MQQRRVSGWVGGWLVGYVSDPARIYYFNRLDHYWATSSPDRDEQLLINCYGLGSLLIMMRT